MTKWRLKISTRDFNELERLVQREWPTESGAFALAGIRRSGDDGDILVRRVVPIPSSEFSASPYRLDVSPRAINGLAALCEANGLGAVLCHSHPTESPYSYTDDAGEARIAAALRPFLVRGAPVASLLFHPNGVTGRVWVSDEKPVPISQINVVGRFLKRLQFHESQFDPDFDDIHDRQVRAFGAEGQSLIENTKVALVGVGGTGSPVAEQLARLGIRDIVLVDPDLVSASNLSRIYGSFPSSVGHHKVDVVANHMAKIQPSIKVSRVRKSAVTGTAARTLLDRDVIFLCTDEHWGRSIVNQIAHQYLIPTINLGMRITSAEGRIEHAIGVVDVLRPDMPCLWCSQFLSARRIAAESVPASDRAGLVREGYVDDITTVAPSVVSATTTLSGLGVTMLLQIVTDFMGESGEVARLNLDFMTGTVRRGKAHLLDSCICHRVRAFGDLTSLGAVDQRDSQSASGGKRWLEAAVSLARRWRRASTPRTLEQ